MHWSSHRRISPGASITPPAAAERPRQMRQMEQIQCTNDLALAGAALAIFYAWNQLQCEAGLSITDPLFARGD